MKVNHAVLIEEVKGKLEAGHAVRIGCAAEIAMEWELGDCHANVAAWVARNPTHRPVLGWAITANCMAVLHSVVEIGEGKLLDITPRAQADMQRKLWFVRESRARAELPTSLQVLDEWPVPVVDL